MKRKTFQKKLMAKGIQRNEAAHLSSEICKTHSPRGTSYASALASSRMSWPRRK